MIGVAVFSFEILRPNSPTISVPDQTGDQFFFFFRFDSYPKKKMMICSTKKKKIKEEWMFEKIEN